MRQEPKTWRDLLAEMIAVPREKQRIAAELGVGARTLDRWVQGSVPRSSRLLTQLLSALPQQRDLLTELIRRDPRFANFSPEPVFIDETFQELPANFYARVLETNATIAHDLRFQSISTLILQQSLQLLDPDRLGLEISVIHCLKPAYGQPVRSLHERVRTISSPQQGTLEERLLFLGGDSLAGHVVATRQSAVIQDVASENQFLPIGEEEVGKSLAAYSIQRSGRAAGCLLAVSPQPYFFTRSRQALLQHYAHLFVLAFDEAEFYAPQDFALGIMPPASVQRPLISAFRSRAAQIVIEALRRNQIISSLEAETMVLQQIEEELLRLSLQK